MSAARFTPGQRPNRSWNAAAADVRWPAAAYTTLVTLVHVSRAPRVIVRWQANCYSNDAAGRHVSARLRLDGVDVQGVSGGAGYTVWRPNCASIFRVSLAPGAHTFEVRGTTDAGNVWGYYATQPLGYAAVVEVEDD